MSDEASSARKFLKAAEKGKVSIQGHDQVLRIAYAYMLDEHGSYGEGVFVVVDQLHARGWSFGEGELAFNR